MRLARPLVLGLLLATPAFADGLSVSRKGQYQCTGTGCVSRPIAQKEGDVISVKDFGCAGDGSTDDVTCMTAISTYVNSTTPAADRFVTVVFPYGKYNYSGGLAFTSPVKLLGQGATLNYTGSGIAVKMGPDGISGPLAANISPHNHYTVEGLSFTGGASSTQGIYFNTFVTQPRVTNCYFYNFGSSTGYAIYFQSQNWDARVTGVKWYASATSQRYNFIRANGIATDGTTADMGQSLMTVSDTIASNQSTFSGAMVGIYTAGSFSVISHVKIEGFSPDIWVGALPGSGSSGTRITNTYMEVVQGSNPCIMYGESSGPYTGLYTEDLTITNVYCNVHNTDLATTAHFLGPAGSASAIQDAVLLMDLVINNTAGQPVVVQNNLASQVNNRADRVRQGTSYPDSPPNPLHTAGGSINVWSGTDGEYMVFANSVDAANILAVQSGKTSQQYGTLQIQDYLGALLGAYQCSGAGLGNSCILYGPTTSTGLTVPSTGGITIKSATQANLGTPANGTLLYCSDCTPTPACAGSGAGALASRQNGAWSCNGSGVGSEHDFSGYRAVRATPAATLGITQTIVTNASTLTANSMISTDVVGAGGGNFVVRLCSDGVTCGAGNIYLTCTQACTAGAGVVTACSVTKAAVAAGTVLTWEVGTACATTDPGVNVVAHMTTP